MPVSVQVVARRLQEEKALRAAKAIENILHANLGADEENVSYLM
jgi:Asp-tRNA(Asn)/Glu-tRNA(Gln) amidotransferase A subunit family amidase